MTVPAMAAPMGVPDGAAMSIPAWRRPHRRPYSDVTRPAAGRRRRLQGARTALPTAGGAGGGGGGCGGGLLRLVGLDDRGQGGVGRLEGAHLGEDLAPALIQRGPQPVLLLAGPAQLAEAVLGLLATAAGADGRVRRLLLPDPPLPLGQPE